MVFQKKKNVFCKIILLIKLLHKHVCILKLIKSNFYEQVNLFIYLIFFSAVKKENVRKRLNHY
jgi:hypothetical protein